MYFSFEHLEFRYRPFPIGCARPLMEAGLYREFLDNYPPLEIFADIPKLGSKYSLSERFNAKAYADFVASRPLWREFRGWLKSDAFLDAVLAALKARGLDLGYVARAKARRGPGKLIKDLGRGRLWSNPQDLTARFEFSMLPADGGHILPHTDTPSKIVTLIVSMVGEGDSSPISLGDSFGGKRGDRGPLCDLGPYLRAAGDVADDG